MTRDVAVIDGQTFRNDAHLADASAALLQDPTYRDLVDISRRSNAELHSYMRRFLERNGAQHA